jgi:hypothetical protein
MMFVIASSYPAQAANAVAGNTSPNAPTSAELAPAKEIVDASGDREKFEKSMAPFESMLAKSIVSKLAVHNPDAIKDPAVAATVTLIVRNAMSPVYDKTVDAEIGAYSENFSVQELNDIITFIKGPGGQAERTNLPLLKAELSPLMEMSAADAATMEESAERAFSDISPSRRELVLRIFKAQDLEAHTRRGYASFFTTLGGAINKVDGHAAAQRSNNHPNAKADAEEVAHAADNFTRMAMAVQKRFYTSHYSDAELNTIATYLESEAGQAAMTRNPMIKRAAAQVMQVQLVSALATLDEAVCSAVTCSSEQRAELAQFTQSLGAALPAFSNTAL